MIISPRYDGPSVFTMDGPVADQAIPTTRQRNRLGDLLSALSLDDWATPSRCAGWTVQDVVAHVVGVNRFWEFSVRSGLEGNPTQLLRNFDPVTTPAAGVQAAKGQSEADTLDQYLETNAGFLASIDGLTDEQWMLPAESPAGHVPLRYVAQHALWDCWIHERDIAIPLGVEPAIVTDELISCLRYAVAVSPALAIGAEASAGGSFAVAASDPSVHLIVDVADSVSVRHGSSESEVPCLRGSAVDLVEALTLRMPLPHDAPPEWRTLLTGLATAFDATPR